MKKLSAAVAAGLFIALSGPGVPWAQTPKPKPVKQTTARKSQPARQTAPSPSNSLCVASAIGHKFDLQTIGIMVFGNALQPVAIDSWKIDDVVADSTAALVGKRFAVRRINFPTAALAAYEIAGGLFRDFKAELAAALHAAASGAPRCDLYLSVTRSRSNYGGTNQELVGLGVLKHSGLISRYYSFANFTLRLHDGSTFAVLRMETPQTDPALLSALTSNIRGLYRTLDESWWPATPQAAAQSTPLRNATRELVGQGLAKAVPAMLSTERMGQ
jgi:hypothetical protein